MPEGYYRTILSTTSILTFQKKRLPEKNKHKHMFLLYLLALFYLRIPNQKHPEIRLKKQVTHNLSAKDR